jgi:NAD(P)-dependent dehydrogenase (short-subunit alcohol dehydrogenase family)
MSLQGNNQTNSEKRVIVTGGSSGIGKAISEVLLQDGYRVHSVARTKSDVDSSSVVDLLDASAIKEFCQNWDKPLYALINNAGICKTADLASEESVWNEVMRTNLSAVYHLTKGIVRHLVDNGRIVNISSQLGKEGRVGYGAYCASKFGVIGLTKCWAKELGKRGITVNAVCPGWVNTEMAQKDLERLANEAGISKDEYYKQICEPLELKRFTEPEEVANLASFLISDKASGITGRDMLMNTIWNQE